MDFRDFIESNKMYLVWQISSAKSFDAEDWQLARTAFIKTKAQKILNFGGNVVLASAP